MRRLLVALASLLLLGFGAWLFSSRGHSQAEMHPLIQSELIDPRVLGRSGAMNGHPMAAAMRPVRYMGCDDGTNRYSEPGEAWKVVESAARKVSSELAANLRVGNDKAGKVLGAYLQMMAVRSDASAASSANRPDCWSNPECQTEAWHAADKAASPIVDDIAKIASTSDRPEVYALGLSACVWSSGSSLAHWCSQLSYRQWARLEPDNAIPWIFIAQNASRTGDLATRDDALFHASRAKTSNLHWSAFASLAERDEVRSQPLEVQSTIDIALLGIVAAMWTPPYEVVMKYCSIEGVSDANRRQVCGDLARVMTEHADDLVSLTLGVKIGERVGWAPGRLETLRNRKDALFEVAYEQGSATLESCEGLRQIPSTARDSLQYGEIGSLQRRLAASGDDEPKLAERFRSQRQPGSERASGGAPVSPPAIDKPN